MALCVCLLAGCPRPIRPATRPAGDGRGDALVQPGMVRVSLVERVRRGQRKGPHRRRQKASSGPSRKKWGVDIVLKEADYDTCLTMYGSSTVDAVCMTNMDSWPRAWAAIRVAVLPTSTSVGADACIVVGIDDLEALKGKTDLRTGEIGLAIRVRTKSGTAGQGSRRLPL